MILEARQAPAALERMLRENQAEMANLASYLRRNPPPFAVSVARGSSDHAAMYGKYLLESLLGLVCSSATPSVQTLYGAQLQLNRALMLALSQSGQSPDILEVVRQGRRAGALTVALVNQPNSPLASEAEVVFPLHVGEEKAVAATKSYLAMGAALAQLVSLWHPDPGLRAALEQLPESLHAALQADWSEALEPLRSTDNTLVVGRGYAFAVANELALKLKETGALHAEALSAAELLHGPVALVEPGFPVVLLALRDRPLPGVLELAQVLRRKEAHLLIISSEAEALDLAHTPLPLPARLHPVLDPLLAVQAFYPMASHLAVARGHNPDQPRHLSKVTRTR